jgi:hypothetical protein
VPQILNARHGVFIVENLSLSKLAADAGAWTSPVALV